MEQQFDFVTIVFVVCVILLVSAIFEFIFERINKWCYQRDRKRFKAEVDAGKQPNEVPYLITNTGTLHIDMEDIIHTTNYKRLADFCERNQ